MPIYAVKTPGTASLERALLMLLGVDPSVLGGQPVKAQADSAGEENAGAVCGCAAVGSLKAWPRHLRQEGTDLGWPARSGVSAPGSPESQSEAAHSTRPEIRVRPN